LPTNIYLGFAVSSDTTGAVATVRFRDFASTSSTATGTFTPLKEPLGPSSRATGLVISEIMYHPAPRADGRSLEFLELANARSVPESLTGWHLTGDVAYTFPDGFVLPAGEIVVVAAAPDDVKAVYGITNVLGPYAGRLPHDAGTVQLRNNAHALRLDLTYSDRAPWPAGADGAGPSLVLARPSLGEANPVAWAASEFVGGSPGFLDPTVPDQLRNVMINEFLAQAAPPAAGYLELYNHSNATVDLSGAWLSDEPATNKFRIPDNTSLRAGGFLAFDFAQLGFAPNAAGASFYLVNANGTRLLDAASFGPQETGIAVGRCPDGSPNLRRLARPTPGGANASWRQEDIVINELMYAPLSGADQDQYVELFNRGEHPVDLSGWKFTAGISFVFPTNTTLAAGAYLVVGKNVSRLRSNYAQLTTANTIGDFAGNLDNDGERLALAMPQALVSTNELGKLKTNWLDVVVAEVTYGVGGRWGQWANGGGSSLELIDPHADSWQAANWADSDETAKAPWTAIAVTNRLDQGNTAFAANRLRLTVQGAGECLVDDVEVFRDGTVTNLVRNPDFEAGATNWSFFGNHSLSTNEATGGASGPGCLHVRGQDDGDTGVNGIRTPLKTALTSGSTGVIRAKVRWLAGWPEILFRLQGNYLELPARLSVPPNLGTPGLRNSRGVTNAGPAISEVAHRPLLPQASEPVRVTARLSDPDGIGLARVQYRRDPDSALSNLTMTDDGRGADEIAGDGVFSATVPGQASGTLIAFRVVAKDAVSQATTTFPAKAPAQECLIRWGEPQPSGTFSHYHLWSTTATEQARNRSPGLDNTWRNATLVCGNFRVIYNVGFRDKGSPYHSGYGDIAVTVPEDDLLLGATERNFASTGNGGPEETNIRSQLAAWLAQQLGLPYLHAHYLRLYRNGGLFRSICEDLEVPNRPYARRWFPEGGRGDLYKASVWFEFQDDNVSFSPVGCTLEAFRTTGNAFKLARYRWNWERRLDGGTANNYTNLFELVSAANDTSTNYAPRLLALADMEEWMRVFAYHRIMGNWDSWTYNVGQNMYLLKQPGQPWVLMPWDIDFTFGLGDGSSSPLGGGSLGGGSQDPVANRLYDAPAFRRMLWRAHQDAANGPLLATNYAPQVAARRSILLKNGVTDSVDPRGIGSYIDARRNSILNQLKNADAKQFAITSNNGNDFTSATPTVALQGTAPFAVATIEINGIPYPITWSSPTLFRLNVPLTQATNLLALVGKDRLGQPLAGASDAITITYPGAIPRPQDFVVINEIHYNPVEPNASFLELFNRSTSVPFDLSGFRLDGAAFVFPPGSVFQPGSYLVLAKNKAAFSRAYGATVPVFAEFPGSLAKGGEHLELVRPGAEPAGDQRICDVRYDNRLPWPTNADGAGPSLQLVDAAQDIYRVGNWRATATNDANRVTPGRANAGLQSLTPFPPLWLNEIQPRNTGAVRDRTGASDPWLELFNRGTNALDLSPYYLTDDYADLTRWQFPTGATIGPRQFLLVWADGQPDQTTANELHASFRLSATNGSLALVRLQGAPAAPAVMDYFDYPTLPPGRSYGCAPDGEPRHRQWFQHATPGETNDPAWLQINVRLNELLAANNTILRDPANDRYEDWFELHNAEAHPVDLSGYTLTSSLDDPRQFVVPVGTTLPAQGFLLVWADKLPGSNQPGTDLHVNFRLSRSGSELGLFDPAGVLLDGFAFGPQTNDVSTGRFPDGADLPLLAFAVPTPGTTNSLAGGNVPPVFAPLDPQTAAEGVPLQFTVLATDSEPGQQVRYSLGADAPAGAALDPVTGLFSWTPQESDGPGDFAFSVRATDDGLPPRAATLAIKVTVAEVNQPPVPQPVPPQSGLQGELVTVQLQADDPDLPRNRLTFSLDTGPLNAQIDPLTGLFAWTPAMMQPPGAYTVTARVTDDGLPPLSATVAFTVSVAARPHPPIFSELLPLTVNELARLQVSARATDPDTPPSPIVYSLDLAPVGAQIDPTTGLITWRPSETQGPTNAVFVVRATKSALPDLSATATFGVKVLEVNQPPALTALTNRVVSFGQSLLLTNYATDTDMPPNRFTFTLDPGAPAGMTVDPLTGVLTWTPLTNQVPTVNEVTVRVTDDGEPPLSDAQSFLAIATGQSPWRYVSATGTASSSTLYLYLTAPGEVYVDDLRLVAGSQPGLGTSCVANGDFENPLTGTWTISPNHAGSALDTRVKHSGLSSLHMLASAGGTTRASSIYQDLSPALTNGAPYTLSFWYLPGTTNTSLTVRLSGSGINSITDLAGLTNASPQLQAIADQNIDAGETVDFFVGARDANLPNDEFAFSLAGFVPPGATINPRTGEFIWPIDLAAPPGTNLVTVRVTDAGAPPLSDQRSFRVIVQRPPLTLLAPGLSAAGLPTFHWVATPGRTYRVEFKTHLAEPDWQLMLSFVATEALIQFTDVTGGDAEARFYRVVQLP
jgi:hypothetical protein